MAVLSLVCFVMLVLQEHNDLYGNCLSADRKCKKKMPSRQVNKVKREVNSVFREVHHFAHAESVVKAEWHPLKKKCFPEMLVLMVGLSVGVTIH